MQNVKHRATITVTDDGTDEVRIKCEFGGDGGSDDSAAHRTAADMMRSAVADSNHDELVAALKRAKDWIEVQMADKGWPMDRIENPPEGSHLHAINQALAKAG